MKNIEDLRILIMTLPHCFHRYWYMVGMLDAMKYPLDRCYTVMGKYWKDYEDNDAMIDAMIDDGFLWADRLRLSGDRNHNILYRGFRANMWSACRCIRWASHQEFPVLIMEDDSKLALDWRALKSRVRKLPEYTEVVVLSGDREYNLDPYNEDWCRGYKRSSGAFCNIYSPDGSRNTFNTIISDDRRDSPKTFEGLARIYPQDKLFSVNPNGDIRSICDVRTPFQQLSIQKPDKNYMDGNREEFMGYGHHSIYDKWVDGLDVDNFCEVDNE